MHGQETLDGLDLDNDRVCDEQIDAVSGVELDAAISDGQENLRLDVQAERGELVPSASSVVPFVQMPCRARR